jgi:hypothetical protein
MGGIHVLGNTYYPLSTYTIVNDIAYTLADEAIILDNITRITNKPSVEYDGETIGLYILYTYDTVVAIIDQEGYDSISGDLTLTEVPSYTINSNSARPVEGTGTDIISLSSINKVRQLPDIRLDETPTTMYMCLDILNNVIVYTDVIGYQAITGLAYTEYNVSDSPYLSDVGACTYGPSGNNITVYSHSSDLIVGDVIFTDTNLSTPYYSVGYVYITPTGKGTISKPTSITTGVGGDVRTVYDCGNLPTPTPTPTLTPTPTPVP